MFQILRISAELGELSLAKGTFDIAITAKSYIKTHHQLTPFGI
jgi:hypothetical protein